MITRDLGDTQIVTAFDYKPFATTGIITAILVGNTTGDIVTICSSGGPNPLAGPLTGAWTGPMIDRLGLSRNFANALVVPVANVPLTYCASSTVAGDKWYGLSYGLQHATATGATWKNLSTELWVEQQGLYHQTTTTSTGDTNYVNQDSLLSTGRGLAFVPSSGATTTTSTGSVDRFVGQGGGLFDLAGAGRYVRVVLQPHTPLYNTSCHGILHVGAALVFGGADLGPSSTEIFRGSIYVTSGCSTTT